MHKHLCKNILERHCFIMLLKCNFDATSTANANGYRCTGLGSTLESLRESK